jgi:hypothetical protein
MSSSGLCLSGPSITTRRKWPYMRSIDKPTRYARHIVAQRYRAFIATLLTEFTTGTHDACGELTSGPKKFGQRK